MRYLIFAGNHFSQLLSSKLKGVVLSFLDNQWVLLTHLDNSSRRIEFLFKGADFLVIVLKDYNFTELRNKSWLDF